MIDHEFSPRLGVETTCALCDRPWSEHRSRVVSADIDSLRRERAMTDAALELVRHLRAFDNDEQVRIVNIALELARGPDIQISREEFRAAAQTLADDCATTIGEAQRRGVKLTPVWCPSNECQIRKACTGHALCTGEHQRVGADRLASPAAEAAMREQHGDGDGEIPITFRRTCGCVVLAGAACPHFVASEKWNEPGCINRTGLREPKPGQPGGSLPSLDTIPCPGCGQPHGYTASPDAEFKIGDYVQLVKDWHRDATETEHAQIIAAGLFGRIVGAGGRQYTIEVGLTLRRIDVYPCMIRTPERYSFEVTASPTGPEVHVGKLGTHLVGCVDVACIGCG